MAKKNTAKKQTKNTQEKSSSFLSKINFLSFMDGLSDETRHSVVAIIFFVIGTFLSVAPFGKAGFVGENIYRGFSYLLGIGYFILPLLFFILGISIFRTAKRNVALATSLGAFLFLFSSLGLINILSGENEGGLLGNIASSPLVKLFDTYVATLFLFAFLVISFLIIFNTHLKFSSLLFWRKDDDNKWTR